MTSSLFLRTMSVPCSFKALKQREGPPLNAWGLYGDDDELGRLNLITAEAVQRGRDAIKQGRAINLNLPMLIPTLHPSRAGLDHKILNRGHCNDDAVSFNTQTSTQWDGFRHYPYQDWPEKGQYRFYGGQTMDEAKDPQVSRNGTQNYVKRPITSRAHLLDVARYIETTGKFKLSYFDNTTPIPLSILTECAEAHGVEILPGDVLLIRTGWTEAFFGLSDEERAALPKRESRGSCGISQSEDVLQWFWEKGIAAAASDAVALEAWPSPLPLSIHEVFLGGWGLPIGELFDLRDLAQACHEAKQYTFFFTSMPLLIEGGIASPPNAQAVL